MCERLVTLDENGFGEAVMTGFQKLFKGCELISFLLFFGALLRLGQRVVLLAQALTKALLIGFSSGGHVARVLGRDAGILMGGDC